MAENELAQPTAERVPRVRVTIRHVPGGWPEWEINCKVNGEEVDVSRITTRQIRPFLDPEMRKRLAASGQRGRSRELISEALNSGAIPTQLMADAYKAYQVSKLAQTQSAESNGDIEEDTALMRMQPATLLVGGAAYRLVPTGGADMRAPLRNIRRKAREVALAEARSLNEVATRDAQVIVRRAEERATEIRSQLERERASAAIKVPQWLLESGRMFRVDSNNRGGGVIQLKVGTGIEDIIMSVERWATTLHWTPARLPALNGPSQMELELYIREEGVYNLDMVTMRGSEWQAPHISYRCCMKLEGIPRTIESGANVKKLEEAISRGMKVVNMNSLLSYDTANYHPWVLAQIPESVRKLIRTPDRARDWPSKTTLRRDQWSAERVTWNSEVPFAEEAATVFTTETTNAR